MENPYLENTTDFILTNTFAQIEEGFYRLSKNDIRFEFEFEFYDISHLYSLAHFSERGLIERPLFIQRIFDILGGMIENSENLYTLKPLPIAFIEDHYLSTLVAGHHQMKFGTLSAILKGGHVRIGLEDCFYLGKGQLAKNNAEQVS